MKKIVLIISLLLWSLGTYAQDIDVFSYEIQAGDSYKSIAKTFDISHKDLKVANPDLPRKPVMFSTIYIPNYHAAEKVYVQVAPGQTLYSISHEYGISVEDIIKTNDISEELSIGVLLVLPRSLMKSEDEIFAQRALLEETYVLHKVEKGDTFYSLENTYDISQEQLEELNEGLADSGLQIGMLIKIKLKSDEDELIGEKQAFVDSILSSEKTFHIDFMLPLKLKRNDTLSSLQTFRKKGLVLDRVSDYYFGAMIAIDSLREQGINIEYRVYDTENKSSKVQEILMNEDFDQTDLIVGPFYSSKAEDVANRLSEIPVLFPMYSRNQSNFKATNFIKPEVDKVSYAKRLNEYILRHYCDEHIVVVRDTTAASRAQSKDLIASLRDLDPNVSIKTLEAKSNNVDVEEFNLAIDSLATNNWVIMTNKGTTASALVQNVVAIDNTERARLFANEKDKDFDIAQHHVLSRIDFTYASSTKLDTHDPQVLTFFEKYQRKFNAFPSKASIKGFDEVYDILMRYYSSDGHSQEMFSGLSKRVENFYYYADDQAGIKTNQEVFIMRYQPNMEIIEEELLKENPNIFKEEDLKEDLDQE
ncbi:LysM peptidoglycan-binding domain-containing protein [Flavobacteriaceae bacterium]|nr:LysM peptidoglycan-binding domain-containing protein [Flavobacteriaceae bacterium]